MESIYNKLFNDELIIKRVKNKLPHLFQLAELESSRNGKLGMEIGSAKGFVNLLQCLCAYIRYITLMF